MRQFLRWEYLLCKRFFRRKSFLVLLLLLPLMGLLIRAGSREKSGILEIGIVAEEKEGKSSPLAASIAENLLQSESVLHYRSVKSESAAPGALRPAGGGARGTGSPRRGETGCGLDTACGPRSAGGAHDSRKESMVGHRIGAGG